MSGMVILTLLELTGYALQDIIDAKNSGDAVVYSSLIGNSIKRYGNTRDIDLSVLVDKITPEVKAAISKKLTDALQKKQKVLQADVEADLAKFFSEESNDEDFPICVPILLLVYAAIQMIKVVILKAKIKKEENSED
ncbi:MAG: hypothetical protein ACLR6B_04320 [Blautia sp.]